MVSIVAGNGLGLFNTSLNTVGAAGELGQSVFGQGSSRAIVNVVNGNLVLQTQDAQLAGSGMDLYALRTYNSLGAPTDGDNYGWRWGYEQTVRFQGPGTPSQPGPGATVVRIDGDGHETTYTWDAVRAAYVGTEGSRAYDELRYDSAAAEWVWTDGSTRVTERYSDSTASGITGRLILRTDTSSNSIALTYDDGRLTLIRDTASKQELRLTYGLFNGLTRPQRLEARPLIDDANGHPTATLSDPLPLVEYDYDGLGRLTTVTRHLTPNGDSAPSGAGFITNYSYDDSSTRIASVTQHDGTSVTFTYDAVGRLSGVKDHGVAPLTQFAFAYGTQPNTTAITDGDGQVWTYRHDGRTGQLTEVLTPPVGGTALSTSFLYDTVGNLVSITDPHNNTVTYGYDNSGNRVLERDAIGKTTTRTFSALYQMLTETRYRIADPDGAGPQGPGDPATTRYVYDANSRLRFIVSAEGRVTENRYGTGYGLLTQTMLYVGKLYDVTGLGPAQQLTETELTDWVAGLPDKTQVQLTEYIYDLRGNVSQQTSYATVSAGGAGVLDGQASVSEYIYDAHSQLRQRIAVRGGARNHRPVVASFVYDGMTRVVESTGANGGQTTVYDDANRRVTVTAASGLTEIRDYDSRRRLVNVSQTGDGTTRQTRYVYDNADQLRMVEDAQDGQRYRFYNAAGRLEYKVDATGAVTRFEHNAAGQLVRQTQYVNRADTASWYDGTSEAVTKATLTVGGTGSDLAADATRDRVTSFDYDGTGQLTASTDAAGTVTTMTYDGLSRVVMTQTGDRVTRFLYDKDDRRVGIVDALSYLTEYRYDAGGRLVETVRYSRSSPVTADMTVPAWRPADLAGLHSYFFYDGQGRVIGTVDEQQFLTETVYDDALNTQRTLRHLTPVTVATGDTLASLKSRAGVAWQMSLVQFDDFGRVHETTALDGSTLMRNEYDAAGRLTRVVRAANTEEERARRTFYNAFGEVSAVLDGEGDAWLGPNPTPQRIDEAIRDYGIRYDYDSLGRMIRSVDANGNLTLFYYDRENRRTHTVNVIGQAADDSLAGEVHETAYDSFGQVESVHRYATRLDDADVDQLLANVDGLADPLLLAKLTALADANLDQVVHYEYDRSGRLLKQVDGEGGFTENVYNVHGELTMQVRSIRAGQTTTRQIDYDLLGRVVSQTDYDAFGRVVRSVDAAGQATTTDNPDSGRSMVVTDPLQRTTRTDYDALGRFSRITNALGQQTAYVYDDAARRVTTTTPEGRQTTTTRTRHGETRSIEDARGNVTRYGYNRDGRPTTVTDALGRLTALTTYDKSGRRLDVTDAHGTVTRFAYDQRNRVVEQRVDPAGMNLATQYAFDTFGQQVAVTEGAGTSAQRTTTYGHDRKGRVRKVVVDANGLSLCTSSQYDDLDNVVAVARGTVANPDQHVMLYEFDNLGRKVSEIAAPSTVFGAGAPGTRDITTLYRYDATGRLTRRIDANGRSTWHVYDAAGQRTNTINALGEVGASRHDAAGRLIYSHRYLERLTAGTLAAFGDVVGAMAAPTATPNDPRSHIVYDDDGQPRFNLKAAGAAGWTIGENRLDENGNVIEIRAYDQFLPDAQVAALDSAASPGISVAEIQNELVALGYQDNDPSTLAGVQRTFFAYDANNRQHFTVDPSGAVTESVYDTAGTLTATLRFAVRPALTDRSEAAIEAAVDRDDPDNRLTRYVQDAANRLRYTIDATGAVSENQYDARGNLVKTVRWSTRPSLTQYAESAVSTALAALPSANDQITRLVYDAANRLRYTIDATGAVSENAYDAVGNVVATTRFARRPTLTSFSETAVDAALVPLRADLDNQVNRFAFDANKRLRFAVDPLGSIIESAYDAEGNLLLTLRFAARPALAQLDEAALAAAVAPLRADPKNRATRFAYDALGRLRFTVDALGSVSERIYDALGNLAGSVRHALRPALAQYSEEAIAAAVAPQREHPQNRVEHHLHDPLGRLRFSLLRLSVDADQPHYRITAQELNALGQTVSTATYATSVTLPAIIEAAITSAVGAGDGSRDRVTRFVYDLDGRPLFRLQAVSLEADRCKYRVSAQRYDAFGQGVASIDYATAVALDAVDRPSVDAAVQAVADPARDRVSAVVFDELGQPIYGLLKLDPSGNRVVRHAHDALGRVVRTTQYASPVGPLASVDRRTLDAAADAAASLSDRSTQYVYDAAGRQRFVLHADKTGHWTVAESRYDALGNLVELRRCERYLTDEWIAGLAATRPLGLSEADVTEQLAALGYSDNTPVSLDGIQRTRFAYDAQNRLRFTVDALGSVAENVYDALGDLTTTVRFAARPELAQYTERGIDMAVDRSDAANRVQHTVYDALGQLRFQVQVITPNTASTGKHWVNERRYDALGQLIDSCAYATPVGPLTSYDEATLAAAAVADPGNDRRSRYAFDAGGRQAFALRELREGPDEKYVVTGQIHDALDQLVQRIDYAAPVALTQFDGASVASAVVVQPWADRITTTVSDAGGRLRFEIKPDLSFRESTYDALGQLTESRQFDFTMPDSAPHTEAQLVALRGSRAVGDGITRGQVQTWDATGRLTRSVDGLGNPESYAYDALDGRTQWTDKNGHNFACTYDRRGRKTSETTPPMAFKLRGEELATPAMERAIETRFEYDAFGNLVRKIEAANFADDASTTDFVFDTAGRPTDTLYNGFYDPSTGTVEDTPAGNRFKLQASITYDALGNAVRFSQRTGVDSYLHSYRTYDNQGQVVHEINALNHVTRYGRNAFGEHETVTRYSLTLAGAPQNGVYWTAAEVDTKLNWGFDEIGNLLEDAYARTIRLAYDTLGRKISVTMPTVEYYSTHLPGDANHANAFRPSPASIVRTLDAAVTHYAYSAFGDLIRQRVRANTIVEWQETSFSYDAMGRRVRSVDAAGNVTSMTYDPAGNLVRQEEPTGQPDGSDRIIAFAYNLLDQQIRVDRYGLRYTDPNGVEHGVATWSWENGGQWHDPDADVATIVRTAGYDAYGRPVAVTDAAGNLTTMQYNALGQLVQVTAPPRLVAPLAADDDIDVDPFRNQLSETLLTAMSLDPFGRAVRMVRATSQGSDARETVQRYDAGGNLVSTTDAEGGVKHRACNFAGRTIKETQTVQADLGPLGLNTEGFERRYVYDALGQLTDTLDVYLDGTELVQSGKSAVYNAFSEVVEERRKWGPANQDVAALNTALVAWHNYDNAGRVFEKLGADRLTLYSYNLLGQVTREEKRGNSSDTDGTGWRITEFQYDVLGRPTMVRRPAFDADVTPGTGTTVRLVTPYSSRTLDRWGNVTGTQEGGYEVLNGQPSYAPHRTFRSYSYDDDNRVVTENLGTHGFVSSSGASANALISRRLLRDLLGNVVKEVDEARDPQAETLISVRTRHKQYDSTGRLTAEIDATDHKVEYVYNVHGERLGTRNARGTVFFDRYDRNGNIRFHGVLRTSGPAGPGAYDSHAGTGAPARTYLNAYLYDQANRRFASKTFTGGADVPWSYTWLDGRNLGVRQRDAVGRVTQYRFDPFGNKASRIDSGGARSEWHAATTDYAVGRIDTYQLPSDHGQIFGRYTYSDFGEMKVNAFGNTITEYDHHKNGLVQRITIRPDFTQTNLLEMTTYQYDVYGRVTMEGRIDATSIQTKLISYDNQGRLARVEDQNKAPGGPICDVRYAYDEWSNVRRIQAGYTQTDAEGPRTSDSWYTYDLAGRMTVSNGSLSEGTIKPKPRTAGSVKIHYDDVGHRDGTTEYQGPNRGGPPVARRSWDAMRDERYDYDDLGHLRRIDQRLRFVNVVKTNLNGSEDPVQEPDRIGAWQPLSSRSCNLRGDALSSEQWTRIGATPNVFQVDKTSARLGTMTTIYRADGQVRWTKFDAVDPKKSTETQNTYDAPTGLLASYLFKAFRTDGAPFNANFEYRHTLQNGERVVGRIRGLDTGWDTFKTYDRLGRLAQERVELPKPNGLPSAPGSDRYEERLYHYGADGRVILKNSRLGLSASGPDTVPLPTPTTGQQAYVYAGSRMAAAVGAERLAGSTKFDFAYTPMSEASGSGSSRYVVQSGESLIDIAQATYGDGALWYVIADANGIVAAPGDELPSIEVGKAYEIPDVVRATQAAGTADSYSLAQIVGNDRPIAIPPPPPPKHSDIEMMAVAAVSITIQVGATVGLSALGMPMPVSVAIGAGLSNLAGQATSWGLGMQAPGQDGIDWGGVGLAAMEGFLFSAVTIKAPVVATIGREFWGQAKSGFQGWTSGPGLNWSGIGGSLFNVGFEAVGPVLGGAQFGPADLNKGGLTVNLSMGGLINSAYNPRSGWAILGSGRSPAVGAFEFYYSAVANGLGMVAYDWIRKQLSRPSPSSEGRPPGKARPQVRGSRVVIGGDGSQDRAVSTNIDDLPSDWPPSWEDEAMAGVYKDYRLYVARIRSWWERYKAWEIERFHYPDDWTWADRDALREALPEDIKEILNSSDVDLALKAGDKYWLQQLDYVEKTPAKVSLEEYRKQRDGYYDYSSGTMRFVPPTTCVYNVVYEGILRNQEKLAAQGLTSNPGNTFAGPFPGANPYVAGNSYYNYTKTQLDAAINSREIQSILAKMDANRQAGPVAIAGGLIGAFGAWLGGGDTLEGYSRGVELAGIGDAFLSTWTDAIQLRNATAAQPYRPEIVEAPSASINQSLVHEKDMPLSGGLPANASRANVAKGSAPPSVIVAEPMMTESRAMVGAVPIQKGGTVVNPDACTTNCVPVARVTDQTLRGNFSNQAAGEPWAAASQPGQMVYPPAYYKTKRSTAGQLFNSGDPARDLIAVETDMLSRPNSTAVIVGYRNPATLPNGTVNETGHAFNAVNYNGRVFYVDGQSGIVFDAAQMYYVFVDPSNGYYQGVHVVPTGKLNFWVPSGWFAF